MEIGKGKDFSAPYVHHDNIHAATGVRIRFSNTCWGKLNQNSWNGESKQIHVDYKRHVEKINKIICSRTGKTVQLLIIIIIMTNIVTYIRPICEYSDGYKIDQTDFLYESPKSVFPTSTYLFAVCLFRTATAIKPTAFVILATCFQIINI
jgi:hypothetical protein